MTGREDFVGEEIPAAILMWASGHGVIPVFPRHMVAQRISDNNRRLVKPEKQRLPTLPALVWTLMGTFLLRRDWKVHDSFNTS